MPFRKARERIEAALRPVLNDSLVNNELASLSQKFQVVNNYSPETELAEKTAEELMRLATEAGNARDKITYYEVLLKRFPSYDRADEAQFMIGFVYSEELRDKAQAQAAFEKMLANYPDSQIRDSASYMLKNLDRLDVPNFEKAFPDAEGPSSPRGERRRIDQCGVWNGSTLPFSTEETVNENGVHFLVHAVPISPLTSCRMAVLARLRCANILVDRFFDFAESSRPLGDGS